MKQTILSRLLSAGSYRQLLVATMCMLLLAMAPVPAMAQRRGSGERTERTERRQVNNSNNGGRRQQSATNYRRGGNKENATRPVNNQRPAGMQSGNRKDNNHKQDVRHPNNFQNGNRPNYGNRPNGSNNNGNGNRPNVGNHNGNRPNGGNNWNHNGNGNRPNGGNNWNHNGNGNRPNGGNNWNHNGNRPRPDGPSHTWNPGRPNHVHHGHWIDRPPIAPPPMRPWRPAHFYGYRPPVPPPPSWRPGPRPLFSTVLGLTFGSAINICIDALITNGYTVDGYADDVIYVNDAVQLNMRWPFGVLQYNNGLLASSEFSYSSEWRDLNRYNMAYARLSSLYGPPVSNYNQGGDLCSTWWGPNGQYVTLRFDYRAPMSGRNRFYTTLSFGI